MGDEMNQEKLEFEEFSEKISRFSTPKQSPIKLVAPEVDVFPQKVYFPQTFPNSKSHQKLIISNGGRKTEHFSLIISGDQSFSISDASISVSSGDTQSVFITFSPKSVSFFSGSILIKGSVSFSIPVVAHCIPSPLSFPQQSSDIWKFPSEGSSKTICLSNSSLSVALRVTLVSNSYEFTVTPQSIEIPPSSESSFVLKYSPPLVSLGPYISIQCEDDGTSAKIYLKVVDPRKALKIDFGTISLGQSKSEPLGHEKADSTPSFPFPFSFKNGRVYFCSNQRGDFSASIPFDKFDLILSGRAVEPPYLIRIPSTFDDLKAEIKNISDFAFSATISCCPPVYLLSPSTLMIEPKNSIQITAEQTAIVSDGAIQMKVLWILNNFEEICDFYQIPNRTPKKPKEEAERPNMTLNSENGDQKKSEKAEEAVDSSNKITIGVQTKKSRKQSKSNKAIQTPKSAPRKRTKLVITSQQDSSQHITIKGPPTLVLGCTSQIERPEAQVLHSNAEKSELSTQTEEIKELKEKTEKQSQLNNPSTPSTPIASLKIDGASHSVHIPVDTDNVITLSDYFVILNVMCPRKKVLYQSKYDFEMKCPKWISTFKDRRSIIIEANYIPKRLSFGRIFISENLSICVLAYSGHSEISLPLQVILNETQDGSFVGEMVVENLGDVAGVIEASGSRELWPNSQTLQPGEKKKLKIECQSPRQYVEVSLLDEVLQDLKGCNDPRIAKKGFQKAISEKVVMKKVELLAERAIPFKVSPEAIVVYGISESPLSIINLSSEELKFSISVSSPLIRVSPLSGVLPKYGEFIVNISAILPKDGSVKIVCLSYEMEIPVFLSNGSAVGILSSSSFKCGNSPQKPYQLELSSSISVSTDDGKSGLAMEGEKLIFNPCIVGQTGRAKLRISNHTSRRLSLLTSTSAPFYLPVVSFDIEPRSSRAIPAHFTPMDIGDFEGFACFRGEGGLYVKFPLMGRCSAM